MLFSNYLQIKRAKKRAWIFDHDLSGMIYDHKTGKYLMEMGYPSYDETDPNNLQAVFPRRNAALYFDDEDIFYLYHFDTKHWSSALASRYNELLFDYDTLVKQQQIVEYLEKHLGKQIYAYANNRHTSPLLGISASMGQMPKKDAFQKAMSNPELQTQIDNAIAALNKGLEDPKAQIPVHQGTTRNTELFFHPITLVRGSFFEGATSHRPMVTRPAEENPNDENIATKYKEFWNVDMALRNVIFHRILFTNKFNSGIWSIVRILDRGSSKDQETQYAFYFVKSHMSHLHKKLTAQVADETSTDKLGHTTESRNAYKYYVNDDPKEHVNRHPGEVWVKKSDNTVWKVIDSGKSSIQIDPETKKPLLKNGTYGWNLSLSTDYHLRQKQQKATPEEAELIPKEVSYSGIAYKGLNKNRAGIRIQDWLRAIRDRWFDAVDEDATIDPNTQQPIRDAERRRRQNKKTIEKYKPKAGSFSIDMGGGHESQQDTGLNDSFLETDKPPVSTKTNRKYFTQSKTGMNLINEELNGGPPDTCGERCKAIKSYLKSLREFYELCGSENNMMSIHPTDPTITIKGFKKFNTPHPGQDFAEFEAQAEKMNYGMTVAVDKTGATTIQRTIPTLKYSGVKDGEFYVNVIKNSISNTPFLLPSASTHSRYYESWRTNQSMADFLSQFTYKENNLITNERDIQNALAGNNATQISTLIRLLITEGLLEEKIEKATDVFNEIKNDLEEMNQTIKDLPDSEQRSNLVKQRTKKRIDRNNIKKQIAFFQELIKIRSKLWSREISALENGYKIKINKNDPISDATKKYIFKQLVLATDEYQHQAVTNIVQSPLFDETDDVRKVSSAEYASHQPVRHQLGAIHPMHNQKTTISGDLSIWDNIHHYFGHKGEQFGDFFTSQPIEGLKTGTAGKNYPVDNFAIASPETYRQLIAEVKAKLEQATYEKDEQRIKSLKKKLDWLQKSNYQSLDENIGNLHKNLMMQAKYIFASTEKFLIDAMDFRKASANRLKAALPALIASKKITIDGKEYTYTQAHLSKLPVKDLIKLFNKIPPEPNTEKTNSLIASYRKQYYLIQNALQKATQALEKICDFFNKTERESISQTTYFSEEIKKQQITLIDEAIGKIKEYINILNNIFAENQTIKSPVPAVKEWIEILGEWNKAILLLAEEANHLTDKDKKMLDQIENFADVLEKTSNTATNMMGKLAKALQYRQKLDPQKTIGRNILVDSVIVRTMKKYLGRYKTITDPKTKRTRTVYEPKGDTERIMLEYIPELYKTIEEQLRLNTGRGAFHSFNQAVQNPDTQQAEKDRVNHGYDAMKLVQRVVLNTVSALKQLDWGAGTKRLRGAQTQVAQQDIETMRKIFLQGYTSRGLDPTKGQQMQQLQSMHTVLEALIEAKEVEKEKELLEQQAEKIAKDEAEKAKQKIQSMLQSFNDSQFEDIMIKNTTRFQEMHSQIAESIQLSNFWINYYEGYGFTSEEAKKLAIYTVHEINKAHIEGRISQKTNYRERIKKLEGYHQQLTEILNKFKDTNTSLQDKMEYWEQYQTLLNNIYQEDEVAHMMQGESHPVKYRQYTIAKIMRNIIRGSVTPGEYSMPENILGLTSKMDDEQSNHLADYARALLTLWTFLKSTQIKQNITFDAIAKKFGAILRILKDRQLNSKSNSKRKENINTGYPEIDNLLQQGSVQDHKRINIKMITDYILASFGESPVFYAFTPEQLDLSELDPQQYSEEQRKEALDVPVVVKLTPHQYYYWKVNKKENEKQNEIWKNQLPNYKDTIEKQIVYCPLFRDKMAEIISNGKYFQWVPHSRQVLLYQLSSEVINMLLNYYHEAYTKHPKEINQIRPSTPSPNQKGCPSSFLCSNKNCRYHDKTDMPSPQQANLDFNPLEFLLEKLGQHKADRPYDPEVTGGFPAFVHGLGNLGQI